MIKEKEWTMVIRPSTGWFDFNPTEVWRYRDLIRMMVKRDFVAVYKQTILGPLWFLVQPLLMTIMYTVIFSKVAKLPTDGVPPILFYLSGTLLWNYFASCINTTSNTFVANAGIFGKVYFPRIVIPISVVITNMLSFAIQFAIFCVMMLVHVSFGYTINIGWTALITPVLLVQMACLGLGCGIIVSSMTTKYRDLALLVNFGVQLWMYATPVVYPLSLVDESWRWLYLINPMTAVVELFRSAFLGGAMVQLNYWWISLSETIILLIIGMIMFSKVEKNFMDTV